MTDDADRDESARAIESGLSPHDREKYRVLAEIARGGMGAVLRGHDTELGRDVAIKVLDPELAQRAEVRQRFVEEAQIGGQLQHPGVVPVYELGLMADERPWFAMKLVKGETLAELLAAREAPTSDRGRLLGVFEAVCQTVAYAHSKSVIHRDLKPANVMVGAFGEVQVVDWGLAKVLSGELLGGRTAPPRESLMTVIETVRSKEGSSAASVSLVGSVLGTPAYMPPEQAQGNIEGLDARADVFALGAILCEILTGAPPYVATEGGPDVLELAADAQLEPALARLESAKADEELKALCRRCLEPGRGSRPKDAGEVAEAVHDYIVHTEERAHRAELEAADQKLAAERASRRVQVTLLSAGLVLILVAGAGGGAWWLKEQEAERAAELSRAFSAAQPAILQASRSGDYERALELARDAKRLVESGEPNAELRQRAEDVVVLAEERLREELDREEARLRAESVREAERRRLAEFEAFLEAMETGQFFGPEEGDAPAAYEAGFARFGISLDDPELPDVLEPHRYTDLGIRIARGFDEWARVLRDLPNVAPHRIELLAGIGLDLDPDPLRAEVRHALVSKDVDALLELYESQDFASLPPETTHAIGTALVDMGLRDKACHVLSLGAELHPGHFLLTYDAALANKDEKNNVRALALLRAALSMRPEIMELHVNLSQVGESLGDHLIAWESALVVLRLAPEKQWNLRSIGDDAWFVGRWRDAADFYGRALEADPANATTLAWKLNAEAYGGLRPLDEVLDELATLSERSSSDAIVSAYTVLLVVPPRGHDQDARRALAFAEGRDSRDFYFWIILAAANALLGQPEAVLANLDRASALSSPATDVNWYTNALHELVRAVGHRMAGDTERADHHLRAARTARAVLFGGREDAWADSWLEMVFEQFEPVAEGR